MSFWINCCPRSAPLSTTPSISSCIEPFTGDLQINVMFAEEPKGDEIIRAGRKVLPDIERFQETRCISPTSERLRTKTFQSGHTYEGGVSSKIMHYLAVSSTKRKLLRK